MKRFLLGLLFGTLLTIYSLGIAGVGHGTYAPLAFTSGLFVVIPFLESIAVIMGPISWALYFGLIPKLHQRAARIACAGAIFVIHLLTAFWVAKDDPAFDKTMRDRPSSIFGFVLLIAITLISLLLLSAKEYESHKEKSRLLE